MLQFNTAQRFKKFFKIFIFTCIRWKQTSGRRVSGRHAADATVTSCCSEDLAVGVNSYSFYHESFLSKVSIALALAVLEREEGAHSTVCAGLRAPTLLVDRTNLYVSVHGGGLCRSHQALQLSTAEVLGLYGQFFNVYVSRE